MRRKPDVAIVVSGRKLQVGYGLVARMQRGDREVGVALKQPVGAGVAERLAVGEQLAVGNVESYKRHFHPSSLYLQRPPEVPSPLTGEGQDGGDRSAPPLDTFAHPSPKSGYSRRLSCVSLLGGFYHQNPQGVAFTFFEQGPNVGGSKTPPALTGRRRLVRSVVSLLPTAAGYTCTRLLESPVGAAIFRLSVQSLQYLLSAAQCLIRSELTNVDKPFNRAVALPVFEQNSLQLGAHFVELGHNLFTRCPVLFPSQVNLHKILCTASILVSACCSLQAPLFRFVVVEQAQPLARANEHLSRLHHVSV